MLETRLRSVKWLAMAGITISPIAQGFIQLGFMRYGRDLASKNGSKVTN